MAEPIVYVNGKKAGEWKYGYTPFNIDVTPFVNKDGSPNTLAVHLQNVEESSRWYPGAGLYRPVTLIQTGTSHLRDWGINVETKEWKWAENAATIKLSADIESDYKTNCVVRFSTHGQTIDVKPIASKYTRMYSHGKAIKMKIVNVDAPECANATAELTLEDVKCWSPEHPQLYDLTVSIIADGGKGKVLVFVGSTTNTVMRVLAFEEDVLSDEQLYTFVGTWPQSAKTPGAKLCDGELSKLMGKISGNTYYAQNHMGSAFQRDHRATDDEKAWLADYTAKPSTMDGFNRWGARRITLYPYGRPYPADCNQHSIGDCNTISTLATMAYLYPRFIQSIITQVSDKEFQVKMFDPDGNRIIVGVDNQILLTNDSYIAQVTGKSNRLTWATILEKAIMKWLTVYRPGAQLGGFGAEGMTPLFTGDGRSFAISPGRCTAAELQQFVTVCINHGLIVNGGFNKQGLKLGNRETITAHGHSFVLANDPEALFAVRNPWGGDPDDHVFQVYDADHAPSGFDGTVPSTIDLRIISPGIASLYYDGPATPNVVP